MDITINIESRNAEQLAHFYANLFNLNIEKVNDMPYDVYKCNDNYGGFTFLKTGKDTTGISFSVKVGNVNYFRERALKLDLNISCDDVFNSFFQIKDPQDNIIGILR